MSEITQPTIGQRESFNGQDYTWNGSEWVLAPMVRPGDVPVYLVGPKGETGPAGPPGEPGAPGTPGTPGTPGEPGEKGEQGLQGERGLQGIPGEPGADGEPGVKGDPGERGLQGLQGDPGERGLQGLPGEDGEPGVKGDPGDQGIQGERGIQGLKGDTGSDGTPGLKGDPGDQGVQGIQGIQGAPGVGVPVGGTLGQVLAKSSGADYASVWVDPPSGGGSIPSWYGHAHAAYAGGNTPALYERIMTEAGTSLTLASLTVSIIRLVRFQNPADITINCLRGFVPQAVSSGVVLFTFAIYNDALQKITGDIEMPSTALSVYSWVKIGASLNIALQAGQFYYLAVSAKASNANAPLRSFSQGSAHLIYNAGVPPELSAMPMSFHTANTTTGALPSTITMRGSAEALAGGFPAVFLCNT